MHGRSPDQAVSLLRGNPFQGATPLAGLKERIIKPLVLKGTGGLFGKGYKLAKPVLVITITGVTLAEVACSQSSMAFQGLKLVGL